MDTWQKMKFLKNRIFEPKTAFLPKKEIG